MGITNIQWCDYTFNPWLGCRKVAPECENCYITSTPPFRFRGLTHGKERVRTAESTWKQPLAWNRASEREGKHPRVFCLSLGDWLDNEVPIEWLADLLELIKRCDHVDWLLLTKRPQNWFRQLRRIRDFFRLDKGPTPGPHPHESHEFVTQWLDEIAPQNVWIGVSAGADQRAALDIPAKIHFLSYEPMLHAIDRNFLPTQEFDWIIFGGESGKKARLVDTRWIRDGLDFCRSNRIAPFIKQLGANCIGYNGSAKLALKDSHGGDMSEWPEDLRVREFPI